LFEFGGDEGRGKFCSIEGGGALGLRASSRGSGGSRRRIGRKFGGGRRRGRTLCPG